MKPSFIILASGSPRRREFLELLNLPFVVVAGDIDETPLLAEPPAELVQRLSRGKAEAVAHILTKTHVLPLLGNFIPDSAIIIAADTVVVLEHEILGKPSHPTAAAHMLKQLREKPHYVYSGITVGQWTVNPHSFENRAEPILESVPTQLITRYQRSQVWMRPYTDEEIAAYIASGDPLDKAGAYGIQNKSFAPVARLEGCFASVMGLPFHEIIISLHELGVTLPDTATLCSQHIGYRCCQAHNLFP